MSHARVFLIELTHVREVRHCWILAMEAMSVCVCAQYLCGESGNENNLSLIRTRSLCCPGRAWHLRHSLGSTFVLYSRAGPRNYALPYNWFAGVPKSTHKATPDFTRFLFKEKRWHRQQETVVIYHSQFQEYSLEKKREILSGSVICSARFLLFTWFLP